MTAMGGPQALVGWVAALVIVVADGLVWSELGAAMPGSGGSYQYLREGFGRERWGRLVAFLFIWQFILSGPLEIASGYIGFARYLRYVWPGVTQTGTIAVAMGVPRERILVENQSSNTGENVAFTRRLLAQRGLDPQSFIVVQKPYMERRSYATFRKVWPEKALVVTSPRVSFDEYLQRYSNETLSPDDVVGIMVGDLQRIRVYPARGFQIEQEIPPNVWEAYLELVSLGYVKYLCER
jgi:uncharacterized SAM-binding protein YcdF (DUF218 family)